LASTRIRQTGEFSASTRIRQIRRRVAIAYLQYKSWIRVVSWIMNPDFKRFVLNY
jgi:hypothetical protein